MGTCIRQVCVLRYDSDDGVPAGTWHKRTLTVGG